MLHTLFICLTLLMPMDDGTIYRPRFETESVIMLLDAKGHSHWAYVLKGQLASYALNDQEILCCKYSYGIACIEVGIVPTWEVKKWMD